MALGPPVPGQRRPPWCRHWPQCLFHPISPPLAWTPVCAPSPAGGELRHRVPDTCLAWTRAVRNRRRARTSRACTVPTGQPRKLAIAS
jgi:hypothetical protein